MDVSCVLESTGADDVISLHHVSCTTYCTIRNHLKRIPEWEKEYNKVQRDTQFASKTLNQMRIISTSIA